MGTGFLHQLGQRLTHRSLASWPAVWGKVPSQGDFVHHRATLPERQAWQDWVETIWSQRPQPMPAVRTKAQPAAADWHSLDVVRPARRLAEVPIAFVLPPGSLAFAPSHHVQGVMVPSTDKVGRACPFIIYQSVSAAWIQRQWPADMQADGKTQLFWWARLAWQAVHGDLLLRDWLEHLDALWALQAPGLAQWMGAGPNPTDRSEIAQLLGGDRPDDPAFNLRGVYHLPWADWPARALRMDQPEAAFWTQDAQGGYVQAGTNLLQLWGRA